MADGLHVGGITTVGVSSEVSVDIDMTDRSRVEDHSAERNHQDNTIVEPGQAVGQVDGKIECRERLGGMLRYYYRDAA